MTVRPPVVPYVDMRPAVDAHRQLSRLAVAARPAIIRIADVIRQIDLSIRSIRWEEMRERQALYAARTLMDGRRRHGAVKHARDELRRVRKRTARSYP